ncbi:S8 family serine peptidase, partial [Pelomonas sp. KK5]|uniref:S8 family peptidase n=1 Tax=Pelomonas sp. KK5 TaxID=1855730 RepID=UPI001301E686
PLNEFQTLSEPAGAAYNDPYVGLQRGFAALGVAEAQRWSRGEGVSIAVVDTGLDAGHPELRGRIAAQRDFVGAAHPLLAGPERHGTQVAGVIAAEANNRLGIVGVAPQARLLAYRACWEQPGEPGARCNSFTLAQALGAAIAAGADVINLSLSGPPDPLLDRLAAAALARGTVIVGAVPAGGAHGGFPGGVAGVLAVRSSDEAPAAGTLAAPGRDILTLAPGGSFDFASGSSLAAAQISGTAALLRALVPGLAPEQLRQWLQGAGALACEAVRHLRAQAQCSSATPAP